MEAASGANNLFCDAASVGGYGGDAVSAKPFHERVTPELQLHVFATALPMGRKDPAFSGYRTPFSQSQSGESRVEGVDRINSRELAIVRKRATGLNHVHPCCAPIPMPVF